MKTNRVLMVAIAIVLGGDISAHTINKMANDNELNPREIMSAIADMMLANSEIGA